MSEKENGEYTPLLEDLGIPGHLFVPKTRGQGTVNKTIHDMTVCPVELMAKKFEKSLLSLHPCLVDLEDLVLLWVPDSKQGKQERELNVDKRCLE